jgi:hypothetical protein
VIDHALLDKALAGLPAASGVQVREACARWADCGSRSTPPRTRGQARTAPRAVATCTTAPATPRAPAARARSALMACDDFLGDAGTAVRANSVTRQAP